MSDIKKITIIHINPDEIIKNRVETHYKNMYSSAIFSICDLSNISIKNCVGCWSCWVKTPGLCIHKDEMEGCYSSIINSDICVFSHQIQSGFLSGNSKTCMDRLIPLFHPYIKIVNGEMMHYKRYDKMPEIHYSYSLKNKEMMNEEEVQSIEGYYFRCNEHFRVEGKINYMSAAGDIISKDTNSRIEPIIPKIMELSNYKFYAMNKDSKIAIYNGSPRGKCSNTMLLVEQFKKGLLLSGIDENQIEVFHLAQINKHRELAEKFYDIDYHMFIMPLYVHSMPGIVKHFMDNIVPYEVSFGEKAPIVGFFVQSGFKEGYQSFYLRGILSTICKHNKWLFAGCGIKGGMEGLRLMPPKANKKIYQSFNNLGLYYSKNGYLEEKILDELIKPINSSKLMKSAFKFLPSKLIQFYWNSEMKKNGVIERSFSKPY